MDSRTVIGLLRAEGWIYKGARGSHHQFYHPARPRKVTIPHPRKDIPIGTLRSIERQSGVTLIRRQE